jgi:NTE family protein
MPADQFSAAAEGGEGPLQGLFNSTKYDPDGVGFCLSGGGYKAAAFHLGGLIRLNEVGLLPKINRIASVSGGSIAAGLLASKWKTLDFKRGADPNFMTKVAEPLKEFLTEVNLDIYDTVLGLLNPFKSAADEVAEGYRDHLVGKITLQDLPDDADGSPRFVFLATNYELNSPWRFSRNYAADYRVGSIAKPTFPLAQIVAASSAFPPFFCPLTLNFKGAAVTKTAGADKNSGQFLKRALLCDGGIYDNMGLEPIWRRYGTLLVSNSGDPMNETKHPENWAAMLGRIIGMVHRQAENNRVRMLMLLANTKSRQIAYWPLRNTGANYPVKSTLAPMPASEISAAQGEDVRLWSLGEKAFRRLANFGYYLADCAIRSYLPNVPAAPAAYPY